MQEILIENQTEFDAYLSELAGMVVLQQDMQFGSYQEAQAHVEHTKTQLAQLLQHSNALFVEGLTHLAQLIGTQYQPVASIAGRIYASLHIPSEVAKIIDTQVIKNKDSLKLFSEAVNSFYGIGDFHIEESVISVLLTLFPMEPQPFACLGTMIWRKEGIADAAAYYEKIVDLFESPVLDYFAADCYYKAGKRSEAKTLLGRALSHAEKSPGLYEEVIPLIQLFLKTFNHSAGHVVTSAPPALSYPIKQAHCLPHTIPPQIDSATAHWQRG